MKDLFQVYMWLDVVFFKRGLLAKLFLLAMFIFKAAIYLIKELL